MALLVKAALGLGLLQHAAGTLQSPATDTCPAVKTQADFDFAQYISKRWYIQQQMETAYLPKSQNFCVFAEYEPLSKPSFWGYTVHVHNQARDKDGKVYDSGSKICAKPADPNDPAKISVGLCVLPRISGFTTGPYWVLSYDEAEGYALVSGGQPTTKAEGGCRTGSGTNGSGLWIFTRKQQRDQALVEKVRGIAAAQGFDLSVLKDVDQSNCGQTVVPEAAAVQV